MRKLSVDKAEYDMKTTIRNEKGAADVYGKLACIYNWLRSSIWSKE